MTHIQPERAIITTPEQLADYVTLTDAEKEGIRQCRAIMPMKITRHYAALLERDNPDDPLRKLVIPSLEELMRYSDDAEVDTHKDEAKYQPVEGIIHRYPGKVLLMYTTACFAHCRFCFRSEKVATTLDGRRLDQAIGYIRNDQSIRDVIFTGGDPLHGKPERLERALSEVRSIPHVEIIRITTRAPIFAPELFTGEMIAMLSRFKPLILITSFIHPRELNDETCSVLDRLSDAGIVLLQQGPILRGSTTPRRRSERCMKSWCSTALFPTTRPGASFRPETGTSRSTARAPAGSSGSSKTPLPASAFHTSAPWTRTTTRRGRLDEVAGMQGVCPLASGDR